MRGFPIVSLGSLVGSYNACEVLIPQFEIDEYYMGDEEIGKQAWKDKYKNASSLDKISQINVFPNNLDIFEGTMSSTSYSLGFHPYDEYQLYAKGFKLLNIKTIRVDSFYSNKIDSNFFHDWEYYDLNLNDNNEYQIPKLVINMPNLQLIQSRFCLNISENINEIQINAPKLITIDYYFLEYYTNANQLLFNTPLLTEIGINAMLGWKNLINIYSTSNESLERIYEMLITNIDATFSGELIAKGVVDLSAFDLRYWSAYENETGLDVGLLEGSNLR